MRVTVLHIDDEDRDLRKYKARFETDERTIDRFAVVSRNAPKSSEDYQRIGEAAPDLLLIDYDLSTPDGEGEVIGISGVTLTTELRQKSPEVPIILFTRKSVFKIQNYRNIRETLSSIDDIVYKQDVFKTDSVILDELYELAVGYRQLRSQRNRGWSDLLKLLAASESDAELLRLCNPPVASRRSWSVSAVATWIRDTVVKYPGVLYDPVHSATFLGISEEDFLSDPVQEVFAAAEYSGVFPTSDGRWWKSKLLSTADSIMNEKEALLPVREGFPAAWERTKRAPLEGAKCVFSGQSPAEWVCYILRQPVMIKYSLSYKPDSRPKVMDEARVSFEAIRTSNEFDEKLVDALGREMIPEIRRQPKPGEETSAD